MFILRKLTTIIKPHEKCVGNITEEKKFGWRLVRNNTLLLPENECELNVVGSGPVAPRGLRTVVPRIYNHPLNFVLQFLVRYHHIRCRRLTAIQNRPKLTTLALQDQRFVSRELVIYSL